MIGVHHEAHRIVSLISKNCHSKENARRFCRPFPMPTQMNGTSKPDRELWMDHLAISIGSDLRGGSPSIVTGRRGAWSSSGRSDGLSGTTRLGKITRRSCPGRRVDPQIDEFRSYGHDCIQHVGQMMFIPPQADAHMVVNIGGYRARGLGGGSQDWRKKEAHRLFVRSWREQR